MNARPWNVIALALLLAAPCRAQQPKGAEAALCPPETHPPRMISEFPEVRAALLARDFDRLEALLDELKRNPRAPGAPLSRYVDYQSVLGSIKHLKEGLLDAWVGARPRSARALVARAQARVHWAWEARGSGFANTVTEEGWRLLRERLLLAKQDLEQAIVLDPTSYAARVVLITVAMGLSLGKEQAAEYVAQAEAIDPDEIQAHLRMVTFLLPKWFGAEGEALEFARRAVAARPKEPARYILVVVAHEQLVRTSERQRYFAQRAVRTELEHAFERVLSTYPRSRWMLEKQALFCEDVRDLAGTVRAYERAIEVGDPDAMVRLGRMLERGTAGGPADPVRAARLFCRAAHDDDAAGKAELAVYLLEGRAGVPIDRARGLALLREGVERSSPDALWYLGRATYEGAHGLAADRAAGLSLVHRAHEARHIEASGQLGAWLIEEGQTARGVQLLQKAAGDGGRRALFLLGRLAAEGGHGLRADPGVAVQALRRALELQELEARQHLVELLRKHPELRQAGDP